MPKKQSKKNTSVVPEAASRKFYDYPKNEQISDQINPEERGDNSGHDLLSYINRSVIGKEKVFSGPYGLRSSVYCDYTASGKALTFIEDYVQREVLPEYGNTHTTTTVTSLQTTLFRHEARDIIRNSVNASEHDAVLFVGSGTTAAINKLIHALNFTEKPVVFVSPYEHHSNLLPWREIAHAVVEISMTDDGGIDFEDLENQLKSWSDSGRELIGCFSAASNITGILVDVDRVTVTLHRYAALAFWDYATAGAYLKIDMNPVVTDDDQQFVYKDTVFLSPHKFVGGVMTPGVLIAKKKLFRHAVPSCPGGGSVFYVRGDAHRYLQEVEMREEGGTPAIVESIRAGLVFQLKEAVTTDLIESRDRELCRKAFDYWKDVNNLVLLGSQRLPRLPIFSFVIRHPETGLFLHHNFVAALLNDLFGIQARGGCACAGPYAQYLLGIDEELAERIEELLVEDSRLDRMHLRRKQEYNHREILRPGFVRLNLPYFMDEDEVNFVLEAVKLVAENGWKLLPQYIFNPETGEWRHRNHQVFKDRKWLGYISYSSGKMTYKDQPKNEKGPLPDSFSECLEFSQKIFEKAEKKGVKLADQRPFFDEQGQYIRWFLLPSEAALWLYDYDSASRMSPVLTTFYPGKHVKMKRKHFPILESDFVTKNAPITNPLESNAEGDLDKGDNVDTICNFSVGMSETLLTGFISDSTGVVNDDDDYSATNETTSVNGKTDSSVPNHPVLKQNDQAVQNGHPGPEIDKGPDKMNEKFVCKDGEACFKPREKSKVSADRTKEGTVNWFSPPKKIFKPTVQALEEYKMISDGDKVLVCLSGGKDSLSLLHSIRQYQFYARSQGVNFEFGAVTVDPLTASYDPSPLKQYLAALKVPYFYEEQNILEQAANLPYECASICSFCSRMKRGRLYATARREGYNVLAMGQHLDDLAESFLMNAFHNGNLQTMKANYTVKEGDLRVIRPFVYVRETELRKFAEGRKLPIIAENCPACFEAPKERHRTKQILASQEVLFPELFSSLMTALKPLMGLNRGMTVASAVAEQSVSDKYDDDDDSTTTT